LKLTAKEKRKTKRIEKNLSTRICTKTDSFGNCFCPHCENIFIQEDNFKNKVVTIKCEKCGKNFIVTESIIEVSNRLKEKFRGILQKLQTIPYDKIDVVEVGIDRNCDINEVALLCKYFQCNIADLAGRVKSLLGKK